MTGPWVERHLMVERRTKARFIWFRLNSDAFFLGLLAISSAVFDILNPELTSAVVAESALLPAFYLRCGAYILAGALIVWSLALANIPMEVVGRFLLLGAVTFQVWTRYDILGLSHGQTQEIIAIFLILLTTTGLRVSALLSRHPATFTIPPRPVDGEKR